MTIQRTSHRIGVCTWSLRPHSIGELIERVRRLGLDAVQAALSPTIHQPARWGELLDALTGARIDVLSGMMAMQGEDYSTLESIARTGGVRPDETWPANRAHAEAVAALAAAHDVKLVTFHAGFLPERRGDAERGKMIERLRAIADAFGERGINVALETGQETAATLLGVLDELDHPDVGVNFDPANMILYGKDEPVEALRQLAPRVRQIHIKDALPAARPGDWGRDVPVGQGAVNWEALFDIAMKLDPPVNFLIEREAGANRDEDVIAARELAREMLTQ